MGGWGAHAAEAAAPGCERHPPGSGDGSAAAPGTATPPPYTCARPGRPREPRGCSVRTQSAPHGRAGARGHRPTPAECTMHLGAPVVPEEYMMKRGWLNGSCSNSSWGAGSPLPVARKSSRNTLWGHAGGPTVNAPDAGRVREPAGTTAPGCGGHEPGAEPSHGTAEKPTPKFTASRGEPRQRAQRPRCCASSAGRAGAGRWAPEGAPSPAAVAVAGGEGAPPRGSGGAAGDRRPRAPPVRCEPAPGRPWSPSPKGRPGSRRPES